VCGGGGAGWGIITRAVSQLFCCVADCPANSKLKSPSLPMCLLLRALHCRNVCNTLTHTQWLPEVPAPAWPRRWPHLLRRGRARHQLCRQQQGGGVVLLCLAGTAFQHTARLCGGCCRGSLAHSSPHALTACSHSPTPRPPHSAPSPDCCGRGAAPAAPEVCPEAGRSGVMKLSKSWLLPRGWLPRWLCLP
jgi:hypothetical protein